MSPAHQYENDTRETTNLLRINWRRCHRYIRRHGQNAKIVMTVSILVFANIVIFMPIHASAVGGNMILFWDPANGAAPVGWCKLTTYDGYFPRGDSVADTTATLGTTFPTPIRPYTPTNGTPTIGAASTTGGNGGGSDLASAAHTHTAPTVSYTSDDNGDKVANPNLPAFRSMQLIQYDNSAGGGTCSGSGAGVPNVIPAKAIALFTTLPASGWTRVSAQDGKMIRVNSAVATGGGDSEFNDITISGLTGASGVVANNAFIANTNAARAAHTHAPPATLTCSSGCNPTSCPLQGTAGTTGVSTSKFRCTSTAVLPPYVQPILASANADTNTLAIDITAMFDGNPGNGWVVISESGGAYDRQFIRPNSTASLTSLGTVTRPAETFTGTSGATIEASIATLALGAGSANQTHTHSYSVTTNTTTNSNIPPYFNVVIAEKVSFTLQHYEWYINSGTTDVDPTNGPWPAGTLNVAEDNQISAVPAAYKPPDIGDQLRLRIQILVTGPTLAISGTAFKLQFSQTTTGDCIAGSWTDLDVGGTGTAAWRYGTDAAITDGTSLTLGTSRLSPTSTVLETFSKSATGGTVPRSATTGQTIEYDWLIQNNVANSASQYAFRPIETNGTLLGEYNGTNNPLTSKCPSLVTKPGLGQELRHGKFFQDGVEKGFEWTD